MGDTEGEGQELGISSYTGESGDEGGGGGGGGGGGVRVSWQG